MRKWIYIVCTNDELELPVFVSDSVQEIYTYMGYKSYSSVCAYFSKGSKGHRGRLKLERVRG